MSKLKDARRRLLERLNFAPGSNWRVILDRVRIGCDVDPSRILTGVPGLVPLPPKIVKHFPRHRFQPYAQLQWWRDERSDMMILVESSRSKHWLRWPFRLTFIADDATGLLPRQLFSVLEILPQFHLLMTEVAFDFARRLRRHEIQQRVLFGKARPRESDAKVDRWGSRNTKMAKIYFKPQTGCWRFELELGSRFLRRHRIAEPHDFAKLATILPAHISFHTLNQQELAQRLTEINVGPKREHAIQRFAAKSGGALWPILHLVRDRTIGLTNVRRLLHEHPMNLGLLGALEAWAGQWPTSGTRLGDGLRDEALREQGAKGKGRSISRAGSRATMQSDGRKKRL
jgi:hypothetical protein